MNYGQMPMYQNPYQIPQTNNYIQKPTGFQNNGIIWVQGIEGAKAYQIPQNSNAVLMDSEQNRMYIKTSDNIGMCNLRIFDFTEVTETHNSNNSIILQQDLSRFVTKEELNEILSNFKGSVNNEQSISTTKSTKSGKSIITE